LRSNNYDLNETSQVGITRLDKKEAYPSAAMEIAPQLTLSEVDCWRRGWDSNPRMEVLQTSPLGLLGTAPGARKYIEKQRSLSGPQPEK
jgi:hypothetical protein